MDTFQAHLNHPDIPPREVQPRKGLPQVDVDCLLNAFVEVTLTDGSGSYHLTASTRWLRLLQLKHSDPAWVTFRKGPSDDGRGHRLVIHEELGDREITPEF